MWWAVPFCTLLIANYGATSLVGYCGTFDEHQAVCLGLLDAAIAFLGAQQAQ